MFFWTFGTLILVRAIELFVAFGKAQSEITFA